MESLVLELQQEAKNPEAKVSDLLRKALVVATKLSVKEFREWIEQELHGYKGDTDSIPKYRHIKGELKKGNLKRLIRCMVWCQRLSRIQN